MRQNLVPSKGLTDSRCKKMHYLIFVINKYLFNSQFVADAKR